MCAFSFCHAETDFGNYWNLEFEVAMQNQSLPCKAFLYCKDLDAYDVLRLGYTLGFSNAKRTLPCKALLWKMLLWQTLRGLLMMCAFSFCHAETDFGNYWNLESEVAMQNQSLPCKAFYCKDLDAYDVLRLGYTLGFSNAKNPCHARLCFETCCYEKHLEAWSWCAHFRFAMQKLFIL